MGREYRLLRSLHFDVIVTGAAWIKGGQDGAETITTLGVSKEVSAIAEAGIVVFAALIGMPQIDEGSLHRPARARQYLTVDLDQSPRSVRLNEISAFR